MKSNPVLSSAISMCLAATVAANAMADELSIVVMDPLAAPLSCPCVEGYAQREYEVFAKLLEEELGFEVRLAYAASLEAGLKKAGGADIVIGKQSVVEFDLKDSGHSAKPVYRLTDTQGSVTQQGLIVVNRDDPAQDVADLAGYTIIFGSASATEKHAAALKMLHQAGVEVPKKLQRIDEACSDGACKVIDLGPESKTAAVISSYAQPLLEGCGTIKKGDLRVVAKTAEVPFITLFLSDELTSAERRAIEVAIQSIPSKPSVLEALESLVGFVEVEPEAAKSGQKPAAQLPSADSTAKKKSTLNP